VSGTALPRPDHVVIVIEENHSHREIIGSRAAPYLNALARRGAGFTRSYALTHPSQPNYLALFSGSNQGVTGDETPALPFATPNLGADLFGAGLTFAGYSEGLPGVGSAVDQSGAYARKHNPWVDWQGAPADALPADANQPFSSFPADFATLPTVSFVVPDLNHDMHDGTIRAADTWLRVNLGPYITWAQTHNSLLIVTWDEGDDRLRGLQGNHIPTIFVGPLVRPGRYGEPIDHLKVLRTIEAMYGLPPCGAEATDAPIIDVFRPALMASQPAREAGLRPPGPS
jgi:acid phosphatase